MLKHSGIGLAALGVLLGWTAGCEKKEAPPQMQPPVVTVSDPITREVIEWDEYIGRIEASQLVEVRARVSGLLMEVNFKDGQMVKEGELLFKIDPRPYQAEYDRTSGDVAKARAQLNNASIELQRVEQTRASGAASGNEFETKRLAKGEAEGALASMLAAQTAAKLNLEFTEVRAPISGRISERKITPGNLINGGAGQATLLTVITTLDPIYCYVDADEASILKYQRLAAEKKRVSARDSTIPCFLSLADEKGWPREGFVDFVDNRLDPGTGTLRARGVFKNEDLRLIPGFFGRLRVAGSGRFQALLIPDSAIQTDQNQKYVLVVKNDTVEYRKIKIGSVFGTLRSVDEGLTINDRIIVNGVQKARPGGKVTPQLKPIPADAYQQTAAGSPATQALPATRDGSAVGPSMPGSMSLTPIVPPATQPSTSPATRPSEPATGPATLSSLLPSMPVGGDQ